jgi:hypothetical protein
MAHMAESRTNACSLYGAAGLAAQCQPSRCAFWETDTSRCVLERVGLRPTLDERPELTRWLLAVRRELSPSTFELPEEPLLPYNLLPLPGFRR